MICRECGQSHPDYFSYCPTDGKTSESYEHLSKTYQTNDFCTACNHHNKEGYTYCENCGTLLSTLQLKKGSIHKKIEATISQPLKSSEIANTFKKELPKKIQINWRKNWILYMPILVAILVMLVMPNFIISSVSNHLDTSSQEILDYLRQPEKLKAAIYDDTGDIVDVPKLLKNSTVISLVHNVNVEFGLSGSNTDLKMATIQLSNLMHAFIWLPIIILAISGLVIGYLAKRFNLSLKTGILASTVIYTVFLAIMSLIGNFTFKIPNEDGNTYYAILHFSILDAIVTGIILTVLILSITAPLSYYKKETWAMLQRQKSYIIYAYGVITITILGVFLNALNVFSGINSLLIVEDNVSTSIPHSILKLVFTSTLGIFNWFLSLGDTLTIKSTSELIEVNWLKGYKDMNSWTPSTDSIAQFLMAKSFVFLPRAILMIIPILLTIALGYYLYQHHRLKVKEIASYAVMFAVFQALILFFANLAIHPSIESKDSFIDSELSTFPFYTDLKIYLPIVQTFILSFVYGFVFFGIGGYIRKIMLARK